MRDATPEPSESATRRGGRMDPEVESILREMYAYVRACSTIPVAMDLKDRLARIGIEV